MFGIEMTEAQMPLVFGAIGVILGAVIALGGTLIVQIFETWRQKIRLAEERIQKREEFWDNTMSGPFLEHHRTAIEGMIELLSSECETLPEEKFRPLVALMPPDIAKTISEWHEEWVAAVDRGEDPNDPRIKRIRYEAGIGARIDLIKAMSPDARAKFVETGELPWTYGFKPHPDPQ